MGHPWFIKKVSFILKTPNLWTHIIRQKYSTAYLTYKKHIPNRPLFKITSCLKFQTTDITCCVDIKYDPINIRIFWNQNSLADGPNAALNVLTSYFILANVPSAPQISLSKRSLSAAWGAWQQMQCLVPYSENKGYARNPRLSLS